MKRLNFKGDGEHLQGRGGLHLRGLGLFTLAFGFLLSGCASFPLTHEIERTVLMRTLGVDVGTESVDGVAVTASSGARRGAGTQAGEEAKLLFAQADTITAACQKMQGYGDEFVFYGDVEQLVVGQGQAERSLESVLAHVARDPALRLEAQLFVVRGGAASDVLFLAAEGEGPGAADRLEAMREDAALFSAALPKTAREALVELSRSGCTFVPALAMMPKAPGDGGTGAAALVPAGYAIIRNGALAGWTDGESSRGVNLLLSRVDTDVLELVMPDGSRVALKLTGARTTYAPVIEGGALAGLDITCKVEADVAERRGNCVLDGETLRYLEECLAETTRRRMGAAVALGQTLDADYLDLGSRAVLAAPWHKEIITAEWAECFSALPVSVQVEATVARE